MSETSPIDRVGVVGAGFMGSGIAESVAKSGIEVVLHEPEPTVLARSRARITESLGQMTWTESIEQLGTCSLVVERRCVPASCPRARCRRSWAGGHRGF